MTITFDSQLEHPSNFILISQADTNVYDSGRTFGIQAQSAKISGGSLYLVSGGKGPFLDVTVPSYSGDIRAISADGYISSGNVYLQTGAGGINSGNIILDISNSSGGGSIGINENGGSINLYAGAGDLTAGVIRLNSGNGLTGNASGGNIYLEAGFGLGSGSGGNIIIGAGDGNDENAGGGNITIDAGLSSTIGGNITITAGAGGSDEGNADGSIFLNIPNNHGSGDNGNINFQFDSNIQLSVGLNGLKWNNASLTQTSIGSPGTADSLPGDASGLIKPTKYLQVVDSDGSILMIPAFAAS